MPKVILEWDSCDTCPYHFYNDQDWICCKKLGEAIDYYLDYQGELYPMCPFLKDNTNNEERHPLQCSNCGKIHDLDVGEKVVCCGRKYIVDTNDFGKFLRPWDDW